MRADRRKFLKVAGLSILGLGLKPATDALAGSGKIEAATVRSTALSTSQTRWAMIIDQSKCQRASGCTECMNACNQVHNVPHFEESKNEVKWIWKEPFENAFADQANEFTPANLKGQPMVVLCNHCLSPACVKVCPTQATWRRDDGIVMMDMHRCIGCRYCMVACPYGARSFNWKDPQEGLDVQNLTSTYPTRTRGVVEKCTFCAERLADGLTPSCVEACPEKALIFGNLDDPNSEVKALLDTRNSIRRKPALGTSPSVYYLL